MCTCTHSTCTHTPACMGKKKGQVKRELKIKKYIYTYIHTIVYIYIHAHIHCGLEPSKFSNKQLKKFGVILIFPV